MFNEILEIFDKIAQILVIVSLVIGVLQCLFGYRLLRFWITLIGFLAGFVLGYALISYFTSLTGLVPILTGLGVGALIGFLAFKIYLLGVFLYCGITAFSAVRSIPFPEGKGWLVLAYVLAAAAFVAAGVLAVRFARPCIIVITAFTGAATAARAIRTLSGTVAADPRLQLLLFIGMAVIGTILQFLTTKDEIRRKKKKDRG